MKNKIESDYVYKGKQGNPFGGDFNLYNCLRCGSTISENSLQDHVKAYHPKIWQKKVKRYYKQGGIK